MQREDQAVFADGEADAFGGRAAEEFDEAIVAAAAADGVLRAESLRGDFKRGAHVVVEATDEAPVFGVFHAAEIEFAFHGGVMRFALVAEMIGDARERSDNGLLVFEF